jgi:hypothetical protein
VKNKRPAMFRGRHFQDEIIVLCLRSYLRYSLSYRDLEEIMADRELSPGASDWLTFAGVAAVLLLVSQAACLIPARRAMTVDPMSALRQN